MQVAGQPVRVRAGPPGRRAQHPGRHQRRHRQRGRIRHARQKGVRVFMTSPHGRMSPFQQAQMFSLMDANIHNIAVEGVFDDCQDIVKAVSATIWPSSASTRSAPSTPSTGRVCWPRWCTTSRATSRPPKSNAEKVSFTVPSGNFGNVCAGHVARMMGLPIAQLVVATNENDVLDEFFRTGVYRVRGSATRTRPPARRWTFPRPATSSALCLTCWAVTARARPSCSAAVGPSGRFDLSADPLFAKAASALRLCQRQEHPCRPPGHHPRHLRPPRCDDRHAHGRRREGGA
jgi:threonine synthase